MRSVLPLLFLSLIIVFNSCKKENDEDDGIPIITNAYMPLTLGNYWVYDFQSYLPDGTPTGSVSKDTIIVEGDTLINGASYWILNTNRPNSNTKWLWRDASGVILNSDNKVAIPSGPSSEIFGEHYILNNTDTVAKVFTVYPGTQTISTIEGEVECLEQFTTHQLWPNFGGQTIVDTSYFAGFGPVERSYAFASGTKMKGTLIEYNLEE